MSAQDFITWDTATGEITCLGSSPWPEHHRLREGEALLVGRHADPKTHRVSADGRIIRKRASVIDDAAKAEALRVLRAERHHLLAASDWTQMPDSPLSAGERAAWASYRQALRDMTDTNADPRNPVWPEPPK